MRSQIPLKHKVEFAKLYTYETISKLLKFVKAPLLRSDKGSVFPPSLKASARQAAVTLQAASSNYPLQVLDQELIIRIFAAQSAAFFRSVSG